ncbi:hypothetical protein PRNP1_003349 [Phytophthora ramorum]
MATEVSRLLVLGPDHDTQLAVISNLRQLCGDSVPDAQDATKSKVLNLQTKYYRAPVEVHVHQVLDNAPDPALQHELHDYEAVVCVVDAAQRESFLHVHRFAKRIVDALPFDVCLLVAGTSSATTEGVKKMESWCQDNGFEFVDLDDEEPTPGDDDVIDEKRGIERVLEALHCNMWRSMDMTPPKVETATPMKVKDATPETPVAAKSEEAEQNADNRLEEENNASVVAEIGDQDAATDDSRLQSLLQALEIAGGSDAAGGGANEIEEDDDMDMAQFSALVSEVRNVRDEGQDLTDEQRRERAAEVAMKLWSFLGADDEDDAASDSN